MSLKDKAFEAKTITFWNGGGRIYTEPVPLVELEDAEEKLETAQSTITSQAIQLERKDKEIEILKLNLDKHKKKVVLLEDELYSIPESGKVASREIQTLVELLKSDVRLFYGLKDIFQMKETKVAVQDKIDEITQTLKNYE